jgi:hypothetical protein
MARVLFILKNRLYTWGVPAGTHPSSGLKNSVNYIHEMLLSEDVQSKLVHVVDNNSIDREVTKFRPTHVIIEAYWVVPEKFNVLRPLHPKVKWIIRNHSEVPFMAMEGMTMDWTLKYLLQQNVLVSCNSPVANESIRIMAETAYPRFIRRSQTPLLTNYYPESTVPAHGMAGPYLNVGCFGAVRPLKNHLLQAIAAIRCAENMGLPLRFHVNSSRVEGKAEPVVNNLRGLFGHMSRHQLVEHGWEDLGDFLALSAQMDVVTQVSFSETFNFVAANAVSVGTPIVVSSEVPWAVAGIADMNDDEHIAHKMEDAVKDPWMNVSRNQRSLRRYARDSRKLWLRFLKD